MSEYTAKALIEPRDYRVVFVIQKNSISLDTVLSHSISDWYIPSKLHTKNKHHFVPITCLVMPSTY